MKLFLHALFAFVRKEAVFTAAFLCAAISAFFVHPSAAYLSYIDWNTLCILFALMGVVSALRSCGVFSTLGGILCRSFRSARALCIVLVALCFFFSMLITNDVALLTFVPFTIALLVPVTNGSVVMRVVVLQTIAANTGSMLTPLGNPQNLFLFQQLDMPLARFLCIMLPYTVLSALLLLALLVFPRDFKADAQKNAAGKVCAPEKEARVPHLRHIHRREKQGQKQFPLAVRISVYMVLFVLCLLSVFRLLPKPWAAAVVLVVLLVVDRRILKSVDYMLLLTFTAFFVFTGNIAHIAPLRTLLENAVGGHEFIASLSVSQIISNVPATLLLYPFATHARALVIGVNVGGLGTLVASLASLISYKLYVGAQKQNASNEGAHLPSSGRYLMSFTLYNLLFLLALCVLYALIGRISM